MLKLLDSLTAFDLNASSSSSSSYSSTNVTHNKSTYKVERKSSARVKQTAHMPNSYSLSSIKTTKQFNDLEPHLIVNKPANEAEYSGNNKSICLCCGMFECCDLHHFHCFPESQHNYFFVFLVVVVLFCFCCLLLLLGFIWMFFVIIENFF